MSIEQYLPSKQFAFIMCSLALSGGLVYAAGAVSKPSAPATAAITPSPTQPTNDNWEATLDAIEAQNASSSLTAPSQASVNDLLAAAQSPNLTDTVARTLLVNLYNAKSQGLGDDIPTQDQILAAASAQIAATATSSAYARSSLVVVPDSKTSLRTYGNGVISILAEHPGADQDATFLALGNAVDNNDPKALTTLPGIGKEFAAIASDLSTLPVPQTLAPLHLTIVNDFARIGASYADMQTMLTDPLRGLAGFQTYQSTLSELNRLFTQIAGDLNKDGILFNKDEAGSSWQSFLSP